MYDVLDVPAFESSSYHGDLERVSTGIVDDRLHDMLIAQELKFAYFVYFFPSMACIFKIVVK